MSLLRCLAFSYGSRAVNRLWSQVNFGAPDLGFKLFR
jgi:hypothetical protein